MEKTFLQTIGTPVRSESGQMLSRISGILLNTDTGKVAALRVGSGKKVIVPIDILEWSDSIVIDSAQDIIDAHEVHQVSTVEKNDMYLLKKKVLTQSGDHLGKVIDFGINTQFLSLTILVVAHSFLGLFLYDRKIISAKDIVEVKPDAVIVKNLAPPVKMEKVRVGMAKAG